MGNDYHTDAKDTAGKDVYEALDQSINLYTQQIANMRELKKALRLAELIGKKPGELKWKLGTRVREGTSSFFPWTGAKLLITEHHPDGTIEHEFDLIDEVHPELWPEHLRRGYEAQEARKASRRKRPFTKSRPD